MTKAELMEIEEKYGFEIARDPITHEAWGLVKECEASDEIEKIIEDVNAGGNPYVGGEATYLGDYATYRIYCPKTWFDLWGWR